MSSHVLAKNAGADALQVAKLFNVDGWVCVVTGGKLSAPQASSILAVCIVPMATYIPIRFSQL